MTRHMTDFAWTDTYHNGGVEGAPLADWYAAVFAPAFAATEIPAQLPDAHRADPAPQAAPLPDLCAGCELCVSGAIYPADPAARGPAPRAGVDRVCDLLRRVRAGRVDPAFATRAVAEARAFQERAIDAFAEAMPEHFGTLRPATALEAEAHYLQGRKLGIAVDRHLRANAWLHFDNYRAFIRTNFKADFKPR